ncbi:MAG: sigma factor-like helix-turn-helix DNA-binding protein [Pseudomonadota bacterium]
MAGSDSRTHIIWALSAHSAELKRYVRARVAAEDVDDVLQLAALRAIEKASSLQDPDRVLQWLYRVHGNIASDFARKRVSEQRLIEAMIFETETVTYEAEPTCRCSITQARSLSQNYAAILDLVDINGVPLTIAAERLNVSVNNATVRLHRARAALKKRLLEHCGVTSPRACANCRCTYEGCCAA